MLILDGLGDRACPHFGGLTPLEAAQTPNLDRLLSAGLCGLIDPMIPGVPVSTHTGTGALFGLSLKDTHRLSRGPVEAAGIGIPSAPGDVFLRGNFATLKQSGSGLVVVDRRAGRIRKDEGTDELAGALKDINTEQGVTVSVAVSTQHRVVVRLSGPGLSASISDTDPGYLSEDCDTAVPPSLPLLPDDRASVSTAELLNSWINKVFHRLRDHPVNKARLAKGMLPATGIITRGAGMAFHLESFVNHLGVRAAVVTGERTISGLGRLLNFSVISDPRFTALSDTDLQSKVAASMNAFAAHELVFLHIKAPDICSHDHDPVGKKEILEKIDDAIYPLLSEDLVIGVTGDHSTDCNTGLHCGEPVPSFIYAPNSRRDSCTTFGEAGCAQGGLGRISSNTFLYSMLDNMGYLHRYAPADWKFFKPKV